MLGVIIFFLVLLVYGLILSTEIFSRAFPQLSGIWSKIDSLTSNGARKVILAFSGIVIGLWNFFAPDFGGMITPSIIGALIPSLLMLFDSCVLYPNIVEILNIPEEPKKKYYDFIEKYRGAAGIATILAGLLHLALYRIILF